jgi:hypothetical protein
MAPNSYESLKSDVGCLVFAISMFLVFVVIPFFIWLGAVISTILGILIGGPLLGAILGCICLIPAFVFVLLRSPFAFRIYSSRLDKLEQKLTAVRERIAAHKEKTESLSEADRDAAEKSGATLRSQEYDIGAKRAELALALIKHISRKRERVVASKVRYLEKVDKRSSKRTERFLKAANEQIRKHDEQIASLLEKGAIQRLRHRHGRTEEWLVCAENIADLNLHNWIVVEYAADYSPFEHRLPSGEEEAPFNYETLGKAYIWIGCRKIFVFAPWFIGALAILGGIFAAVAAFT